MYGVRTEDPQQWRRGEKAVKKLGGDDSKPRRTVAEIMYQRVQKHQINFINFQNFSIKPPLQKMTCEMFQGESMNNSEVNAIFSKILT